jgi:glutamate racemase
MEFDSPAVEAYLREQLAPFSLEKYSALVLGCTHFNYFKPAFRRILPASMRFVDGNAGTVRELVRQLRERGELAKEGSPEPAVEYFYTGHRVTDPEELERLAAYEARLDEVYDL